MITKPTIAVPLPVTLLRCVVAVAVAAVVLWSYRSTLDALVSRWAGEQDYIYGFLVPPFAAILLWTRRAMLHEGRSLSGSYWGYFFLACCFAMRLAGAYLSTSLIDAVSLVPCLAGLTLLGLGWPGLRWAWPAIIFLVFMVPLPEPLAVLLSQPLQDVGASTSTYLLQTLGIPALAHGNIIVLSHNHMGVEEACSGLRMLMLFLAVCTGAALLMDREGWEKVVLVLSAAPIAVIANVIRITVTGVLYEKVGPDLAYTVFHDLAGYFMMPLAVILLWMEMMLLSLLFPPASGETWS